MMASPNRLVLSDNKSKGMAAKITFILIHVIESKFILEEYKILTKLTIIRFMTTLNAK